jgi:hypothetical protein
MGKWAPVKAFAESGFSICCLERNQHVQALWPGVAGLI